MRSNIIAACAALCALALFAGDNDPYLKSDYYENGNVRSVGYVVFNEQAGGEVQHGYWQYFYPSGILQSAGAYKRGLRDDIWTNWFENGNIDSYGEYDKDKKDGRWRMFYEQGGKMAEGKFSKDLANGTWTYWHTNGVEETSGSYEDGLRQGKRVYHDLQGNKTWVGRFLDDQKNGEWRLEEDGRVTLEHYTMGLLDALKILEYDKDGDLKTSNECEIIFARRTGSMITTFYDDDEEMAAQGCVCDGVPYGVWRYFEDGKMTQKDMGPVPQTLRDRRLFFLEEERKFKTFQKMAEEKEKEEFGPRKFDVVMKPAVPMAPTATDQNGKTIKLDESNFSIRQANPNCFESLRQQAMEARMRQAAAEKSAQDKEEKED